MKRVISMKNNITTVNAEDYLNVSEIMSALTVLGNAGIVDSSGVEVIMSNHTQKILSLHPYDIYQGKDGRWATYVKDETKRTGRRKIVKPTREQLNMELYAFYVSQSHFSRQKSETLQTLFPKWVADKEDEVSELTIQRYHSDWNRYYEGTEMVSVPVVDLEPRIIKQWIKDMIREHNLTRKQFHNMAGILNQILDYAVDEEEILEFNPYSRVSVKRIKSFAPERVPNVAEEVFIGEEKTLLEKYAMEEYLSGVKAYEYAPLATIFMKRTGMRVGEVCALRYEDLEGNYIKVCRMWSKNARKVLDKTKGNFGARFVPLDAKAKEMLSIIAADRKERGIPLDGYIFSTNGKPLSYDAISASLKKYCEQMETVNKPTHKLRKTALTDWKAAGISPYTSMKWAGQKTPDVYYKSYLRDTSEEDENFERLDSIN